jgi:predicted acetyltransferase
MLVSYLSEINMETIKTASFEYLIGLAKEKPEGGYLFTLDGTQYDIQDVLEISAIATRHGYIVIY